MRNGGYDFWVFDLDGTLVDVEFDYIRAQFDRVGDRLGRSFTDEEARALWYGVDDNRDRILERLDVNRDAFWAAFDGVEHPGERIAATTLYPDARTALDAIAGPTGLVTHCQPRLTYPILESFGLRDRFDAVVCCSDSIGWKPDPAPVERVLADLEVSTADRGALVGDGPCDIGAARNAGLDGIRIDRHGLARHQSRRADRAIERLDGPPITSYVEAG